MSDKELRAKLNQIVKLCNELDAEAKVRYGESGNLFFESGGNFHIMRGDCIGSSLDRQEFVMFTADKHCRLGAGAW
jgi:hypothetical protein